jgi:hypothetical protein
MKKIIVLMSLLFLISCQEKSKLKRLYCYQYQQDSSFDKSDIEKMLDNKSNVLDESQLNDSIHWSKMKLVDSIFLKENAHQLYVYRYDSENGENYLCYTTKDSIKLIAYGAIKIDTELVYVIKDHKFKKVMYELIKNDKFIFNQLNEKMPPWLK